MNKYTFFWRNASPFSQWHKAKFTVNEIEFNCAEQYMMYHKALLFDNIEIANKILTKKDPKEQKALGREVKNLVIEIWEKERERIVYEGNYAKFTQNENLKKHLLKTENTILVEASPVDPIWGIGLAEDNPDALNESKWRGLNLLGKILTELRNNLIKEQQNK
jgi:ribA/ribD-fused uncharacterized protein